LVKQIILNILYTFLVYILT